MNRLFWPETHIYPILGNNLRGTWVTLIDLRIDVSMVNSVLIKNISVQLFNVMLPHMVLLSLTMGYLVIGAKLFQYFESQHDIGSRAHKIQLLRASYDQIINQTWKMRDTGSYLLCVECCRLIKSICNVLYGYITQTTIYNVVCLSSGMNEWKSIMEKSLRGLSEIHEPSFGTQLAMLPNVTNKWTFPTAILNALTLVAACGTFITTIHT